MHSSRVHDGHEQPPALKEPCESDEVLRALSRRLAAVALDMQRAIEGGAAKNVRPETLAAVLEICRTSDVLEATFSAQLKASVPLVEARPISKFRASPRPTARITFDDIVGENEEFRACVEFAKRAALSDLPIVISGETGTGKEMFAQAIHNASARARAPFVGINVAAIPRELVESELFGYEQGAFTGARATGRHGHFELAENGTLLLDEVGDMPFELQVKLLRVLQEKTVMRVGGSREIPVRARVIATTHRDLKRAVEMGTFRADLYYRLRAIHVRIPPLRDRRDDIDLLINACLSRYAARHGRPKPEILPRVLSAYRSSDWPGNVRELVHLVEAEASLLRPGETHILRMPTGLHRTQRPLSSGAERSFESPRPPASQFESQHPPATQRSFESHFPPGSQRSFESPRSPESQLSPALTREGRLMEDGRSMVESAAEQRSIEEALAQYDGNVSKAARALGVARGTLYNRMRRFGLSEREAPESTPPNSTKR